MNPLPSFFQLLDEAHSASEAADAFDLHSESAESVREWKVLLEAQYLADERLIDYCAKHASEIKDALRELAHVRGY